MVSGVEEVQFIADDSSRCVGDIRGLESLHNHGGVISSRCVYWSWSRDSKSGEMQSQCDEVL